MQLLDASPELCEALLNLIAEVKQDERALKLLLHCLSLLTLATGKAYELIDAAVDVPELGQTINYGFDGRRGRRDDFCQALDLFLDIGSAGARA